MVHHSVPPTPVLVIVSGPPCSGKTTLARHLAARLRLALITKDTIKETLFDSLGWGKPAWSAQLSAASMQILFLFAEAQVAAHRSCIIEANFDAHLASLTLQGLRGRHPFRPFQIQLRTEASVLAERLRRRAEWRERHPGHLDQARFAAIASTGIRDRLDTIEIGGELVELDTSDFDEVDCEALLARIIRFSGDT
jgi:predicted kinase